MPTYIEQHFENQKLALDNNEYERCTFKNCTFTYSGGAHFRIDDGSMDGCRLELGGSAANTLLALSALCQTQLRNCVRKQLTERLRDLFSERSE